jgi:hypothetical protein
MARSLAKICYEAAGRVLEGERGMNTPRQRLELAAEIEAAIKGFLAFERRKAKVATPKTS